MTKKEALIALQAYDQDKVCDLDNEALKIAIRALHKVIYEEFITERDLIDTDDILAWAKREAAKDDK